MKASWDLLGRTTAALLLVWTGIGAIASAQPVSHVTLTPGWATFGLSLPSGTARSAVQVGSLATQTDVKNRWPDGSIRFAVVTCKVPSAGKYDIVPAKAVAESFTPAVPEVSAAFTVGAKTFAAPLPAAPTNDVWLSGGQVREWRAVVTPTDGSIPHPQLRVIYDMRVFRDGQARVDATVENALDEPPATGVEYSVSVVANGTPIFSHGPLRHPWLTRWRRAMGIGLTESGVTHDFESAIAARTIPRYWSGVKNAPAAAMTTGFDLLEIGPLNPAMCDCGGRAEMAPYPDWTAVFLVHQTPDQKRYVLANGEQALSWPMHLREPAGGPRAGVGAGRYTSLNERPDFWFDNRSEVRPAGPVEAGYSGWGSGRTVPDIAHQPSLAFIPYIVTGDRCFMDEMAFWANFCLIATYKHAGASALLHSNEQRGMAWAIRNLADAAAFVPDGDPVKAYLEEKLRNNLEWFDNHARTHRAPLGHVFEAKNVPGHDKYMVISYGGGYGQLAWALDRANQLGYAGGGVMRDKLSGFVLKLFTSEPDFPREAAMPLWLRVGSSDGPRFYTTMKELREANPGAPAMFNHWIRLALVIAVENRWAGAQDAYDFNWRLATGPGDWMKLADHAGWAILPETHARSMLDASPTGRRNAP